MGAALIIARKQEEGRSRASRLEWVTPVVTRAHRPLDGRHPEGGTAMRTHGWS
jgi:hypothetical protein